MTGKKLKQYSLGYFNFARGLGTLIVIAGHSMALFLQPADTSITLPVFMGAGRIVGAGIMAMFFMVSGFYFHPRPNGWCIRVQSRLLLKRYYLTAAAIVVGHGVIALLRGNSYRDYGALLIRTYLFGFNAVNGETFLGGPIGTVSIFWFILALFVGWITYNLICCIKNSKIEYVCVVLCVLAGWALTKITRVWPMAIPMGLIAVGYIAVGVEIRKRRLLEHGVSKPLFAVIACIALISLAFGYVDMSVCIWKLGLLDVAGSFCMGYILMRLYSKLAEFNLQGFIVRHAENMGLHSIWVLCLHAFEKTIIPWKLLVNIFPNHPGLCALICFVGRLFVISVLFWMLYRLRKKIRRRRKKSIVIEDYSEENL